MSLSDWKPGRRVEIVDGSPLDHHLEGQRGEILRSQPHGPRARLLGLELDDGREITITSSRLRLLDDAKEAP